MWPKKSALQTSHSTYHGGRGEYRPHFSEQSGVPASATSPFPQTLLRPACRRYNADKQLTLYVGIGQALLLAWAVLTPMSAGNQPTVACESVFSALQLTWSAPG